jgi:uncharacterized protein YbjT (DUF2867 family)
MFVPSTFLIFGATGLVGKHFVLKALDEGFRVKVVVRDVSRLPTSITEHESKENLEIIVGNFNDPTIVSKAVKNSNLIAIMAGNKEESKKGPFMITFIKNLVKVARQNKVKRILYQAHAFNVPPPPGDPLPYLIKVRKIWKSLLTGIGGQ